jgi:hypothetical protein
MQNKTLHAHQSAACIGQEQEPGGRHQSQAGNGGP